MTTLKYCLVASWKLYGRIRVLFATMIRYKNFENFLAKISCQKPRSSKIFYANNLILINGLIRQLLSP